MAWVTRGIVEIGDRRARARTQGIVHAAHAIPAFSERPLDRQADLVLALGLVIDVGQGIALITIRQGNRGQALRRPASAHQGARPFAVIGVVLGSHVGRKRVRQGSTGRDQEIRTHILARRFSRQDDLLIREIDALRGRQRQALETRSCIKPARGQGRGQLIRIGDPIPATGVDILFEGLRKLKSASEVS